MLAFVVRMVKDRYKFLIIYSLSAVGFLEMYVALFPVLDKMSSELSFAMEKMPPELFKAFNLSPASLNFSNIESLLAMKHYSLVWPMMAVILAISLAGYLIINEIDKGTSESLLSLPVKRRTIFASRYFTGLALLIGFVAVSIFAVAPLAMAHGVDFIWQNNVTLFIGASLFSWACYSIAIFFSTISSDKGKANMMSGGIIILSYFAGVLASLKDSLVNLKYFSLFNYFNGESLLIKNIYPEYTFYVLGVTITIFTLVAYFRFIGRDMTS